MHHGSFCFLSSRETPARLLNVNWYVYCCSFHFVSQFLFFLFSAHLNEKLSSYIQQFPKVQLTRAETRQGLIRARLIGAKQAKGDVLVFLDSHCEANYGWLEPLLARIAHDRTIVVTPDIEVIDLRTFSYAKGKGGYNRGVFNWELTFKWRALPDYERERRNSDADPIRQVKPYFLVLSLPQ